MALVIKRSVHHAMERTVDRVPRIKALRAVKRAKKRERLLKRCLMNAISDMKEWKSWEKGHTESCIRQEILKQTR
jgi:hypothetical protein